MRVRILLTTLAALLLAMFTVSAQHTSELRINEVLVKNVDNYMDDYGHRSSWIEIHNTSHSTIDIGGCYLRAVTHGDTTLYRVPTGDPKTRISPLGYLIFFCEGTGTKGTLYTNFTLEGVKSVALLNASAKGEPIDEVAIDYEAQRPDVSIGYMTTADGTERFTSLPRTTPNATNDTEPIMARHERFRQMDPHGVILALTAVSVVLSVLLVLFVSFKLLGNYMVGLTRRKDKAVKAAKTGEVAQASESKSYDSPNTGDEIAAIAMALQMFREELHDKESSVLTINRVARAYSPWSSKIYGLRQFNKK